MRTERYRYHWAAAALAAVPAILCGPVHSEGIACLLLGAALVLIAIPARLVNR